MSVATILSTRVRALVPFLAGAVALLLVASPANAFHDGETLKLDFDQFNIHGSFSKKSCSAQADMKSAGGKNTGFSIYWRPGKGLHLLVKHPGNAAISGAQKIHFVFANGKKVTFPMKGKGALLQVPVGLGPRGSSFYSAVQANPSVRIDMPGVKDHVVVDLRQRDKVEAGMNLCREWLH